MLVPVFITLCQGTLELCEPELTWKTVGTKQRTLDTEKGKSSVENTTRIVIILSSTKYKTSLIKLKGLVFELNNVVRITFAST